VSACLYIEGGGPNGLDGLCRQKIADLLKACGFQGRMPRLVACGPRNVAFDRFKGHQGGGYVAILVDSEDPVVNIEEPWAHLKKRDNWSKPINATDEQVLLMTTCMETWIVSDQKALREHYGRVTATGRAGDLSKSSPNSTRTLWRNIYRASSVFGVS
jgi:hypothetical protein